MLEKSLKWKFIRMFKVHPRLSAVHIINVTKTEERTTVENQEEVKIKTGAK